MIAAELIDVTCANIDGCLYHGQARLDFVDRLVAAGGLFIGVHTGATIPVLRGLPPDTNDDELKALGASDVQDGWLRGLGSGCRQSRTAVGRLRHFRHLTVRPCGKDTANFIFRSINLSIH